MSSGRIIELLLDDPDSELTRDALEWAICGSCRGEGTSCAHLGAYTESDRAEMGDEWYEFMDDMQRGVYDQRCDACGGSGKVREVSEAWLDAHPAVRAEIEEWYADEAMAAAERRAGA